MKRIISLLFVALLLLSLPLSALAAGDDDLILTNCDSSLNWSANSQGMDALETDSENKTEGEGSVGATAINGKLNQICYMPETSIDISGYSYMEFDIYFSDLTWFNDCGSVMIELTSSGTCDQQSNRYMKKVMRNLFETGRIEGKENWWHFVLELDDPQGTANGKLNKANFNYFRFYSVDPISTTPNYTMRIDNVRFTNNPDNYHPAAEEETKPATPAETVPKEPYRVEHEDPNAALRDKLETVIFIEIAAVAVVAVLLVVLIVVLIVKNKQQKKDGGKK